jgi:hypothetical protein
MPPRKGEGGGAAWEQRKAAAGAVVRQLLVYESAAVQPWAQGQDSHAKCAQLARDAEAGTLTDLDSRTLGQLAIRLLKLGAAP